ncbi:2Fe-2S iron-sulfur cluster-binding protein [Streptomyces sp. S1D4-11]
MGRVGAKGRCIHQRLRRRPAVPPPHPRPNPPRHPLTFTFDGTEYQGHRGDTLASALLANGVIKA